MQSRSSTGPSRAQGRPRRDNRILQVTINEPTQGVAGRLLVRSASRHERQFGRVGDPNFEEFGFF
jgi:hypothetical protein